jgi:hypothetical protein
MKRKEIKIPTIIGLLLAVGGLVSGILLVKQQVNRAARAAVEETPKDVRITNVNDSSFTVSWITNKATTGFVQYGEKSGSMDLVVSDERDQQKGSVGKYFTHFVNVRGLKPISTYQFNIGSSGNMYGGGEKEYLVTTGPILTNLPAADVTYGQVVTPSGEPAVGALVYLQIPGAYLQSALVKVSGSWVIPLSTSRSENLLSYAKYDLAKGEYSININGGSLGIATARVGTGNDEPVPNIVLGTDSNFLAIGNSTTSGEIVSKFTPTSSNLMATGAASGLSIAAPKLEEKVNSTTPEVIGKAPAGAKVSIEIHSDVIITGTAIADKNGSFSFTVPQALSPGEHTLTVSTIINGLAQKVTRTFTVYAAGESNLPSYSATPSAILVPTKKPTPTTIPTATPRPTLKPTSTPAPTGTIAPTVKPTIKPTATPTATSTVKPTLKPTPTPTPIAPITQMPISGNDFWTWMILGIGSGMIVLGGWWYKKAV